MIKVAVTGAAGRMGSGIIRKISEQSDMEVVAAIEMPNTPLAGKDAGLQAGIGELGVEITGSEKLEETLKASKPCSHFIKYGNWSKCIFQHIKEIGSIII